ncbi:MAG TPA: D-lactate dehydrogenase [Steroidobacteraceae bacterium]
MAETTRHCSDTDSRRDAAAGFIAELKAIVGDRHVLSDARAKRRYEVGFRYGGGPALAVVSPATLIELWRVLGCCVAANKIIIMQAANTGLTGGSTPFGDDYDREVVLINAMRIAKIHIIEEGRQVICLPGATLYQLEEVLKKYGREPHSVIGSSCIGASVMGGICNNSGGSLVRRGPAYTQLAIFARLDTGGQLRLVNHLNVDLGQEPEEILARLESGEFAARDIGNDPDLHGSDHDYIHRVRKIEDDRPARYNADAGRLFEASGSAGKLALFAVRLDTFPAEDDTKVFYVGTNAPQVLTRIRRHILEEFENLPVSGEYIHREAFNVAEQYGKDTFLAIQILGSSRLPRLFSFKAGFEAFLERVGLPSTGLSDKLLQGMSRLFPKHLPRRMTNFRDRFEHHLILKMAGNGIAEAAAYLKTIFPSPDSDFFECTAAEGAQAFLHRFAVAGAAIRFRSVRSRDVEDIVALDIALRRNDREWQERLPENLRSQLCHVLYYGHFLCHVFHQDYIVRKGCDLAIVKAQLCQMQDQRGAEYPAEHNVGHLYQAKPGLAEFYRRLDPCNQFNPGIGQTSKCAHWRV